MSKKKKKKNDINFGVNLAMVRLMMGLKRVGMQQVRVFGATYRPIYTVPQGPLPVAPSRRHRSQNQHHQRPLQIHSQQPVPSPYQSSHQQQNQQQQQPQQQQQQQPPPRQHRHPNHSGLRHSYSSSNQGFQSLETVSGYPPRL